jgi:hypothetical protein
LQHAALLYRRAERSDHLLAIAGITNSNPVATIQEIVNLQQLPRQ